MERDSFEDTTNVPHLFGSLDSTHVALPVALRTGKPWKNPGIRAAAWVLILALDVALWCLLR
jgi:hypothetical protein